MTNAPRPDLPSRRALRLSGYDYSTNGAYVITICTHQRRPLFGAIRDGIMHPSEAGRIVEEEWHRTEEMRPDVILDAFVLMPNHCHGIIILNLPERTDVQPRRGSGLFAPTCGIGTIVGGLKGIVTSRIKKECPDVTMPVWQHGYHDRIIRDEEELQRFRVYIEQNPQKWELDRYFERYEGDVV